MSKVDNGSALNRITNKDIRRIVGEILELPGFRLEAGKKHLLLIAPDGATRGVPTSTPGTHKQMWRQFVMTHSDAEATGGLLNIRRKKESSMGIANALAPAPAPAEFNPPQFDVMERLLRRVLPSPRCDSFVNEVMKGFRQGAVDANRTMVEDPVLGSDRLVFRPQLDTLAHAAAGASMALRDVRRTTVPRTHHNRYAALGRRLPKAEWEPWRTILDFCHRWYREFGTTRGKGGELHYNHSLKEPVDVLLAMEVAFECTTESAMQKQAIGLARCVVPTLVSYSAIEYLSLNYGNTGGVRVGKLDFDHQPYGAQFAMVVSDHRVEKPLSGREIMRLQRLAKAEANGHEEAGELVKTAEPPAPAPVDLEAEAIDLGLVAVVQPPPEPKAPQVVDSTASLSEMLMSAASRVETLENENKGLRARAAAFDAELAGAVAAAEERGREQAKELLLDRILNS